MMKLFYNLQRGVGLLVFCTILLSACVNHISEEEEDSVNNGDIPLKFIADIRESVGTRMANNNFAEGDEVGLFALAGTTTMQEERYVDNLHFIRSSNGEFESNESVYYPDDGVTLNLISYYPYQKSGVGIGESTMQVAVSTTQNIPDDYSHSDFLIASKEEVLASKEAVALTYNHQFFRLKIVLIPGEGENLEDMLSVKPTLSVSGFYTKTSYDFQKKTFSGYSEEKDIIPAGEWEIKDGRLIGKEFILIPQEATPGYQYITLEAAGKLYISPLPSTLQLKSGKQRELEIKFVSAEDVLMSKVNGGSVSWNMEDYSLAYVDGTLPIRNNVYVMANGTVSLSVTTADDVLSVLVLEDIVRDVRGGIIHNYPLVKIGTQYWMRDNLEASSYVGGEALPRLDAVTANVVGYLQSTTEHYFYTANVVLSNKILPIHWSIPDWKDWNILKDYLNGEASLLKSGTWLPLKAGEQVQPATNLSGFNGIPVGMYVGAFQTDYEKKHLAYWTLDNANTAIDIKVFYLKSDTDIIEESNAGVDTKAFAIRCIRK